MTLSQFCQYDIILKFLFTFLVPVAFTAVATFYAVKKRQAPLAAISFLGCFSFVKISALVNLSYLGNPQGYLTYLNKYMTFKTTGGEDSLKYFPEISDFVYQSNEEAFELVKIFGIKDGTQRIGKSLEGIAKMLENVKNPLEGITMSFGTGLSEIMSGCIFSLFVVVVFAVFMYLIKAND